MSVARISFAIVALFVSLSGLTAQMPGRRIAITVDDGPSVEDPNAPGVPMKDMATAQRVAAGLMAALQAEKAPATIFDAYIFFLAVPPS